MVYLLGLVFSFLHLLFLFLHALAFIFWSLLLLASLCSLFLFWPRAVVFSMASTPCWSCGSLPAPRLVSRRCSVSPRSAPMRVCPYSVLSGVLLARTPVPTSTASRVRGIGDALFSSQSLTVLLVGRAGWLHLQRRQNHLPAPPARTAPLRSSPSSALPEDSSHGSRERKNSFRSCMRLGYK